MTHLSELDLALWLRAIRTQPSQGGSSLLEWMTGPLKKFFPFERCLLIHGELTAGQIKMTDWLSCQHEQRYLLQLKETFELSQRGSLAWWLSNQRPFGIDPAAPPPFATEFEVNELRSFGLGRIAVHGVVNVKANAGTYFSFAGIPNELSPWHMDALRLIAPVLNDLFLSHARSQRIPPLKILRELSPR